MPSHGEIGVDSFARTDTQKKHGTRASTKHRRHRKQQKGTTTILPNVKQSFELQRPDLESCRAEAMLRLFVAERCFYTVDRHE